MHTVIDPAKCRVRHWGRAIIARHYRPALRSTLDPKSNATGDGAELTPDAPRRAHGRRLSLTDRYRILELHQRSPTLSYRQLARACGVSTETAHRTVLAAGRAATDLMSAYAEPMLRRWIVAAMQAAIRGDHRPAKDWLLHAGVLDPLPDAGRGAGPAIVTVNAPLPGMPGGPTVIEVPRLPLPDD